MRDPQDIMTIDKLRSELVAEREKCNELKLAIKEACDHVEHCGDSNKNECLQEIADVLTTALKEMKK